MRNGSRFSVMALPAARFLAAAAIITACAGVEVTDPDQQVPTETVRAVSLSPRLDTLTEGGQVQLVASVTVNGNPDPSPALTWRTTDADIATVSSTGVVRAIHAGQVFVVAAVGSASDRAALTVVPADVPVASVVMAPTSASVAVGQTVTLAASPRSATGVPLTGRTIVWSSNENVIATVSHSGVVSGQAPGTATITAESEGHSATATITVTPPPVAVVTLSSASMTVPAGETRSLTAVSRDAGGAVLPGRTATWTTSNPAVATVASSGASSANVSAVAAGSATITATVEGRTATAQVTVTTNAPVPVATVTVSPSSATVGVGATQALSAVVRDASGNVLTGRGIVWSSSANTVATVGQTGVVSGVAQGTATITATSEGRTGTATITVPAPPPVAVATVQITPTSATVAIGATRQLTATTRAADGSVLTGRVITWTTSDQLVATVSGSGLVSAAGQGTATITATSEGRSATSTITVPAPAPAPVATVALSPTSVSLTPGGTQQITATLRDASGNVLTGRTISWSSSANTIATVGTSGLVSAVAQGSATITATSEGRSATASITVTAGGGTGTVRFANEPVGMTRITDWSFPTLTGSGWSYMTWDSFARITQDPTAPTDPSVVEFVYPAGTVGGGAPARVGAPNLGSNRRELYWAFTWKANATWQGHSSGVNKLGFGWQGSRTFGLTWFWNVWGVPASPTISLFDAGITYFHPNTTAAVPIRAGEWHEVEVYYRPSSATGVADGIVKIWVDGILMNNHVNVVTTSGSINDVYFEPTWGGVGDTKQHEDNHRFGQVRISVR